MAEPNAAAMTPAGTAMPPTVSDDQRLAEWAADLQRREHAIRRVIDESARNIAVREADSIAREKATEARAAAVAAKEKRIEQRENAVVAREDAVVAEEARIKEIKIKTVNLLKKPIAAA
jgi:hypothetical protein